jgi:hypothetical protein
MPGLDEKRLDQDGDQEDRDKDRADFVRLISQRGRQS